MTPVASFEAVLFLTVAVVALELVSRRLHLPKAAALIVGGAALAFIPGVPAVRIDPDLVLLLFLPPLLMNGAFFLVLSELRRYLAGVVALAVGAVIFTTVCVAVTVHLVLPGLPWAACAALGAVVSPPDAVAAEAVLHAVRLPRRVLALLEGESLFNDASGLVLFRFAVAAALSGGFSPVSAVATFAVLAVGGAALGAAAGYLWIRLASRLGDPPVMIATSFLLPWAVYVGGDRIGVSGVLATVAAGLVVGRYQHEMFGAQTRREAIVVWRVVVFLLEAFVFVLIGFSLHETLIDLGGTASALAVLAVPVAAVILVVVLSRFVWIFGSDAARTALGRLTGRTVAPFEPKASLVMSWAGMRGVVTLAIALSLPDAVPGRNVILAAAFAVILVTVGVQGSTIGPLIRILRIRPEAADAALMSEAAAMTEVARAELRAVEQLAHAPDGTLRHPRLLEQYRHRANLLEQYSAGVETVRVARTAHWEVVLAAIAAGRREVLALHRTGRIHDEVLRALERRLDLEELEATEARG